MMKAWATKKGERRYRQNHNVNQKANIKNWIVDVWYTHPIEDALNKVAQALIATVGVYVWMLLGAYADGLAFTFIKGGLPATHDNVQFPEFVGWLFTHPIIAYLIILAILYFPSRYRTFAIGIALMLLQGLIAWIGYICYLNSWNPHFLGDL